MRTIYQADHVIDAHLVKGVLEQAGIPAWVLGEHLGGAIGELPMLGLVSVGVADSDVEAADAVLRDWRAAAPVTDETIVDASVADGPLPQPAG